MKRDVLVFAACVCFAVIHLLAVDRGVRAERRVAELEKLQRDAQLEIASLRFRAEDAEWAAKSNDRLEAAMAETIRRLSRQLLDAELELRELKGNGQERELWEVELIPAW